MCMRRRLRACRLMHMELCRLFLNTTAVPCLSALVCVFQLVCQPVCVCICVRRALFGACFANVGVVDPSPFLFLRLMLRLCVYL